MTKEEKENHVSKLHTKSMPVIKLSFWQKLHGYLHRYFLYFYLSSKFWPKYLRLKARFHLWNEARLDRKYGIETYVSDLEKSRWEKR